MIIRILLLGLLCVVGCGDYTSGLYGSDYGDDGGGYYTDPSCKYLCENVCDSCLVWHSDRYFCNIHCERECRYAFCNRDINRYTNKCNQIFTDSCAGDI